MRNIVSILSILFVPFLVQAQGSEDSDGDRANGLNTGRSALYLLNFDLSNTDLSSEPSIGIFDVLGVNHLIPMMGSDSDDATDQSHGIVINGAFRLTSIDYPFGGAINTTDIYTVNLGVGYGYNYGSSLRFYGTLNSAAWSLKSDLLTGGDTENSSDFFPSKTGFLRVAMNWTPLGKKERGQRFGLHFGLDTPFAEGADSSFFLGIVLRDGF